MCVAMGAKPDEEVDDEKGKEWRSGWDEGERRERMMDRRGRKEEVRVKEGVP